MSYTALTKPKQSSESFKFYDWDLHDYQLRAAHFAYDNPFCALWIDMGLGKTVATLTALDWLLNDFEAGRVLVIGPLRVARKTWTDEIEAWAHINHLTTAKIIGTTPAKRLKGLRQEAQIYLINRENVEWLTDLYVQLQCDEEGNPALRGRRKVFRVIDKWPFDTVVIDESTSFKNHNAYRWSALNRVRKYITRLVELTGKPAPKGYMDLWAQIYLLDRGARLGNTIGAFRQRWFEPPGHNQFKWKLKGDWAAKEIQELLSDITLTMRAKDYLDLPEVLPNLIRVTLSPKERKIYKQMERQYVTEIGGKRISAVNAGVLAGKLLQMSNGAVYDKTGAAVHFHDAKIKAAVEFVDAAGGHPVMIAYSYRHDIPRLMAALRRGHKHREVRVLKTEQDEDDWNSGLIDVLIIHPASGGHGLNIQYGGEILLWFGLSWSLELWDQLNARLMGGHRAVGRQITLHCIILEGSYDERVMRTLAHDDVTQEDLLVSMQEYAKTIQCR